MDVKSYSDVKEICAIQPTAPVSAQKTIVPFELQMLDAALNYQKWVCDTVSPFLGQSIMEIGSGTGNMSRWLPVNNKLVLTEANHDLYQILKKKFADHPESERISIQHLDLTTDWTANFTKTDVDTIISFNVLEHIENDHLAFLDFKKILDQSSAKQKRIISFVPAHQWAHGSLDQEFGHFRRYSAKDFNKIYQDIFPDAQCWHRHFNLIGVPGWYIMGKVLRKKTIGLDSVKTFEKICPWFRDIDDFIHVTLKLPLGQSLFSVIQWK